MVYADYAVSVVERGRVAMSVVPSDRIGSDVSDIVKSLKDWMDGIDLEALGKVGARIVLNFVLDEVIPRVVEQTPVYVDLLLLQVVVPLIKNLLAKIDPVA
jgi:hypothetical protein